MVLLACWLRRCQQTDAVQTVRVCAVCETVDTPLRLPCDSHPPAHVSSLVQAMTYCRRYRYALPTDSQTLTCVQLWGVTLHTVSSSVPDVSFQRLWETGDKSRWLWSVVWVCAMRGLSRVRCGWRPVGCAGAARAIGHLAAHHPGDTTTTPSAVVSARHERLAPAAFFRSHAILGGFRATSGWSPAKPHCLGLGHRRGLHISGAC